jgi:chromatin segregation and condensation protein Rec8/ScpA/Scc1 (kleisin family)
MFFGSGAKVEDPVFMPSKDLSLVSIQDAINRVLANAPKETKLSEVSVSSVMSLEDMIDRLSERIQKAMHMTFSAFSGSAIDKREVVVGFLAMLELVKRGMLLVEQERDFAEIRMNYAGTVGAPRYD